MFSPQRRPGEPAEASNDRTKRLRSSGIEPQYQQTQKPKKDVVLPEILPFNIIDDLRPVMPSQALETSPGFSKDKYARDLWKIFSEEAIVDPQIAEMHTTWFECRKPDIQELWSARYPKDNKKQSYNGSSRTDILKTVMTLENISNRVQSEGLVGLFKSILILRLDYIMLMCIKCLRSDYLDEARQYVPTYDKQFDEIVERLRRFASQEDSTEPPPNAAVLTTIPEETKAIIEAQRVNPSRVKSLEKIAGCSKAKKAIDAASYILTNWAHLVEDGHGCDNILLYGSPGTGKSTLALALGAQNKLPVFNINGSHLVDKWLGAPEKNVRALFEMAMSCAPSVVVFDEVDTLCGVRKSGNNDGAQRMTSELLSCLDRCQKVIVIGTTNLPWRMDSAFLRRFQQQIHVSCPTETERQSLTKILLAKYPHKLGDGDIRNVARATEGYTGDAIERCIKPVANDMVMRLRGVTHFERFVFNGQTRYCPTNSGTGTREDQLPDRKLVLPAPFTIKDLISAIEEMASDRDLMGVEEAKHAQWSKQKFIDTS